jgi:hypothetical protein
MWGYGARKNIPCQGTLDPLLACALVIQAGDERLAIVGLDLGRAPARASMEAVRQEVREKAGVNHVIISGSHTHHGPCIEIESVPPTAPYVQELRARIAGVIIAAAGDLRPARIGVGGADLPLNRNRHSKIEPKPRDPRLVVLRADGLDGKPIAMVVNFAAHPTTIDSHLLKWSADFVGHLRARVEEELGGVCVFIQGAGGDLSAERSGLDTAAFGRKLGEEAARVARGITTAVPHRPSLRVRDEEFRFGLRVDLADPLTYAKYCLAFFKDLVDTYVIEYRDGLRPNLSVAVLNGELGVVAVSGEFFSSHAVRLRERARLPDLIFAGYANGYHQYFPTIEAAAEGGYGAGPEVSPAEVGAGERMMDRALFHLYDLRAKER